MVDRFFPRIHSKFIVNNNSHTEQWKQWVRKRCVQSKQEKMQFTVDEHIGIWADSHVRTRAPWDGTYSYIVMPNAVNWGKTNVTHSFWMLVSRLYDHIVNWKLYRIWTVQCTCRNSPFIAFQKVLTTKIDQKMSVLIRFEWTHDCVCVFHLFLSSYISTGITINPEFMFAHNFIKANASESMLITGPVSAKDRKGKSMQRSPKKQSDKITC